MKEFFKGWRRKIGCVTLLMACVLAAGWVRSLFFINSLAFPCGDGMSMRLFSFYGSICASRTVVEGSDSLYWHSHSWVQSDDAKVQATYKFGPQWKLRWDALFFDIEQVFHLEWAWAGFGAGKLSWPVPPLGTTNTVRDWKIVSAEEERLENRLAELDVDIENALSDWNYNPIGNTLDLIVALAERKSLMDSSIGDSPDGFTDAEVAANQTNSASVTTSVKPTPLKLPQRWQLIAIPYWSIVIPLTAISFWLLLCSGRRPGSSGRRPGTQCASTSRRNVANESFVQGKN